ncbi:MAG TPA: glutathione S-transferase family protein [Candidatus Polarisedimenticolaceae bacterium]|nr:glutathione S-transferase family protein [Candidatus Polarisedimenticolaceae bacterium]
MLKLYDYPASGNCYKIRLLLAQLGQPYRRVPVELLAPGPRPAELLRDNPHGRVPLVEMEDGRRLAESNAILWYLARGTRFVPEDAWSQAQTLRWMFFEQNSIEPNLAVVRFLVALLGQAERHTAEIEGRRRRGYQALDAMERQLGASEFFGAAGYDVADIALFAYTHVAGEGGFDLLRYPAVRGWLARVQRQPGHVPIAADSRGLL